MHRHRSRRRKDQKADATPFWADRSGVNPITFVLTCLVFLGGLLLGGSGGSFGDTIVQLLSVPLIVLAAMHWSQSRLDGPDWLALALLSGIALLAIIQLVPLPMSTWSALPERANLLSDLKTTGAQPAWRSVSLNPYATERALQWTLPAIAMFLAVRWMSQRQRRVLLILLFFGAFALLMLVTIQHTAQSIDPLARVQAAMAQAAIGLSSSEGAQTTPETSRMVVGLFSNGNHFATFLAMTIPLVVAMGLRLYVERTKNQPGTWAPWASLLVLVMVALLVGTIQTHSRAALVLGGIALAGSVLLLWRLRLNKILTRSIVASAVVGSVIAILFAASVNIAKLDASVGTDLRWKIHETTLHAAGRFGAFGSGLGTFVQAYQQVPPAEGYLPEYINRAHGDYHELWLETGVAGAALIVLFFCWYGWSSLRAWKDTRLSATRTLIARGATISILMVLLHSYLDYPLRKTAMLVLFGMTCALVATTEPIVSKDREKPKELPAGA